MRGLRTHIQTLYFNGRTCEEAFRRLTGAEDAPKSMDRHHVDCVWHGRGVDVKCFKKSTVEGYLLVEFRNVAGEKGWVYGDADVIAFMLSDGFLVVGRDDLRRMAEGKIREAGLGSQVLRRNNVGFSEGLHATVGRRGRKDVFTYVLLEDVRLLPHVFIAMSGEVRVHGRKES